MQSVLDKLVYLYYPLLLVLLFAGAKWYGRGKWNEESMSLEQMKTVQGFSAVCIMFHHLSQKTCASWLPKKYIVHGLDFFVPLGYFFVSIFFFCSGYGLYKSLKTKPDYLKGFFRRRVLPLIAGYYLSGAVYLLVRFLMGEKFTPYSLFCYVSGIKLCNTNAWFVIALPIFYLFFYLAYRFCRNEKLALLFVCLGIFCYTWIGTYVNHPDYWMRGEWWYNSVHLFPIGLFFAMKEEKILANMKKLYPLRLILSFVLTIVFYVLSEIAQAIWGYYGEAWHADHIVLRRWGCLMTQVAASCAFVYFVVLLCRKVKLGNRVLRFFGTITMEFYLIHGIFIELFGFSFLDITRPVYYIRNVALFVAVVTICSIPAALLFRELLQFVLHPAIYPEKWKRRKTSA